jgi:hypothetical protein
MSRPLILVDVDGVIAIPRAYASYHGEAVLGGLTVRVSCNPGAGQALLKLAEDTGAELAWCTMWEEWANEGIASILGLPPLPVAQVRDPLSEPYWEHGRKFGLKATYVLPWARGRRFVWFDDDHGELREASRLMLPGQGLPVLVSPRAGLNPRHVEEARKWLLSGCRAGEGPVGPEEG